MRLALPDRKAGPTLLVLWLVCFALGIAFPRTFTIFDFIENWLGDFRVATLSAEMPRRSDIVLLTITEETLSQFPQRFPVDREFLAGALEILDQAGVRAVGMDILFDRPTDPEKDQRLAEVVANFSAPLIVGWSDSSDGLTQVQAEFLRGYLPEAVKAYADLARGNREQTVRWISPGRQGEEEFRSGFAPALARVVGAAAPREETRLLYRRASDGSIVPFTIFPIHQIGILPKKWFKGKIVLIGVDLPTQDRHRTPFAATLGKRDGSLPRVVIHAFGLAQFLDGVSIGKSSLFPELLLLFVASGVGIGLGLLRTAIALKIALGALSFAGVWLTGLLVYAMGDILVPLFVPSAVLAAAIGSSGTVSGRALRAEKEQVEALARARSEFLAMMSHEIRTPMNGVLGVLELLNMTKLDGEQQKMVTIVQDSASSLLGILNDVLDFSKIEAGRMALDPHPIEVRRLCEGVIATFATAASNKSIGLGQEIAEDVPEWISADPLRVRQILTNLLGNAIKFTGKGSVRLTCSRTRSQEGLEEICFAVTDTGIGIPRKALKRLFTPFSQAERSTARRFGGTGLGLTISRQLAELMGGRIGVESRVGKGSSFSVHLPLIEAEAQEEAAEEALPTIVVKQVAPNTDLDFSESVTATGPQILVAEDNLTNQWLLKQQLNRLGYRVDLAADGREALDAYHEKTYDLIVTDYHMPRMDARDLARAIRKEEGRNQARVPIIALTANVMPTVLEACEAAGIDDVLSKPIKLSDLSAALVNHVGPGEIDEGTLPAEQAEEDAAPGGPAPAVQDANAVAEEPVLDIEMFNEVFGGINETVRAALGNYVTGAVELSGLIERQAAEEDGEALAKTAHKLASESFAAGALGLGRLCKEMEKAAGAADWIGVAALRPRIGQVFGQVRTAIAEL